ncbi:MAG: nitroreductase family protein [Clostridium sp.]
MSFKDLVLKRESIRGYLDKEVEIDKLVSCIEAARLAPSACNSQPWKFIIVNDKEKVTKIGEYCYDPLVGGINKFAKTAPNFIVITSQKRNLASTIGQLLKHKEYTPIDIGIAAEHICLQASDIGLGTCIIGWFKEDKIKKLLNIPKNVPIELIISIGYYADKEPRKKVRQDIDSILSFNEY